MLSLRTWTDIALGAFLETIFVVLGDEAQCPPIGVDLNRWKHLPHSDPIHELTNGLHVQLRKFRRRRATSVGFELADHSHLLYVGSLYPQLYDDETALLGEAIRRARARYPDTGADSKPTSP